MDGATTKYILNGGDVVGEICDGETTTYLRGINLICTDEYYYVFDAHGDVVNLTDASGNTVKTYEYDAFGVEKNCDDTDTNPFRYCGEYWDSETETYYLRARYYDPNLGRFTSQDSVLSISREMPNGQKIADPLSLNLYTYCYNSPMLYCDSSGHYGEATAFWAGSMWWLAAADGPLPIGDIAYGVGTLAAGAMDLIDYVGLENIVRFATEAANAVSDIVTQAKDAVCNAANNVKSWFNKTFGGGSASPNDPNNWNHRDYYLKQVQNKSLQNAIKELYRENAEIGDGGTADALRYEFDNGLDLKHLTKAIERIINLNNILANETLTEQETKIAYKLLNDLYDAVKYVGVK